MPTASESKPAGTSLKDRYREVQERIAAAVQRSGRQDEDVILVAVTKNASIAQIRELVELGHVDFGESRVQNLIQRAAQIDEFIERHRRLGDDREHRIPAQVRWHMVGHLQRNKVKKLLGRVRLIHSVDSLRLAETIQTCAAKLDEPVEMLVQVNTSGEKTKYGVAPAATRHLVEQLDTMLNLRPRGLMCIGPLEGGSDALRYAFTRCREIYDDIRRSGAGGDRFDILSMGMSDDYELAVECGANIVRIGSAIFGPGE